MKPHILSTIVALAAGRLVGQEPIARPAFEVAVIKPAGPFSLDTMLVAHHESREGRAYELVLDKGGPKFKPSQPEEDSTEPKSTAGADTASSFSLGGFPGAQGIMNFGPGGSGVITGGPNGTTRVSQNPYGGIRLEMSKTTMALLADMVTAFVERPVIDGTGLAGKYQIGLDLPFTSMLLVIQNLGGNGAFQSGFPGGGFGGFPGGPRGPGGPTAGATLDPTASVFQAIQQLGLKLQSRNACLDTIVIDHLEKTPVEN